MSILKSYEALTASSSRSEVHQVLRAVIDAPPFAITSPSRETLVQTLLDDIHGLCTSGSSGEEKQGAAEYRLTFNDAQTALLALKTLGRTTSSSRIIAKRENLVLLLEVTRALRGIDDGVGAADESLRCIANALLLVDDARETWVEMGGADHCVDLLETSTSPNLLFLASRILFLSTASSTSPFIPALLDPQHLIAANSTGSLTSTGPSCAHLDIVETIGLKLDVLLPSVVHRAPMGKEAMVDLLKFTFNLLCHWPKIATDTDTSNEDSSIASAEGKGKETENVKSKLFEDDSPVLGERWSKRLNGLLAPFLRTFRGLPEAFQSASPLAPPMTHILHALLPIPISGELYSTWFSDSNSSSDEDGVSESSSSPVFARATELLDASFAYYFPDSVGADDDSVKQRCADEDVELDHVLSPLVLLITRMVKSNLECRKAMRRMLLPANLDRTTALEGRADTLGRCIRLMACISHERLKQAAGELLFTLCDSDAQVLTAEIGYGNAAGYLFSRGLLAPPPSASESSGASDDAASAISASVNPITGMIEQQPRPPAGAGMTDEEKEREAEKLFVLFERLEKAGGMENPIKKAMREGKMEKYEDERRKREERGEDSD